MPSGRQIESQKKEYDAIDNLVDMLESRDPSATMTAALIKKRIVQTFLELGVDGIFRVDVAKLRQHLGLPPVRR